jgi:SulP family sulfate permease
LLLITLFFGRYAAEIPLAALAAILVIVSYHMSEWRTFLGELRSPRSDVAVLVTTFGLTVLVDLTVAIAVGMVLAAFLFIRRMATVTNVDTLVGGVGDESDEVRDDEEPWRRDVPNGTIVFEIHGPFFFGAVETFRDTLDSLAERPKVLILRMRGVPALDSTGIHAIRDVVRRSQRDGTKVLLCDVQPQPLAALTASPAMIEIGLENVVPDIELALGIAHNSP